MKRTIIALFALFCILAVSCSTSGAVSDRSITVTGSGTVNLKADTVTFNIGISETAATTSRAQEAANRKVAKVLEIVRSFGIEEDCISTANLYFSSSYRWIDGEQIWTGEQVSQTISVRMKDIDSFAKLVDELGSSVSGISLSNVSFVASDYSKAAIKARQLAYQDARDKALVYAMSGGMRLGNPVTISDGYDNYSTYRNYAMDAKTAVMETASAGTETPVGLLSVTVNVSVVFDMYGN